VHVHAPVAPGWHVVGAVPPVPAGDELPHAAMTPRAAPTSALRK